MPRRPASIAALALVLPVLALGACSGPPVEVEAAPPVEEPGFPAYAAHSREKKVLLRERLQQVVSSTRPLVLDVQARLARKVAELEPPIRFATKEPRLRRWGQERQAEFQELVQQAYATTHDTLAELYESAVNRGIQLAQDLTPERSPLDKGATGNVLLDATVSAFEETLQGMFDFSGMELRQQQDVLRRVELLEVFSSFTVPGADDELGGRLLLFVGGDERSARPRARIVLRCAEGVDPDTRRLVQAARHRVMRGSTTVHDTGWRLHGGDDGSPRRHVEEGYILASEIAPRLLTSVDGFDQLRDMRVVVDLQTAVLDPEQQVLGGVDWRIEFLVTIRGDVSWRIGASPAYDPECPELSGVASLPKR